MTTKGLPANRLEELRGDRHIVEIAAVCGVGERTMRRWEANEVAIPDEQKLKLAAFHHVSTEYLMGWDRTPATNGSTAS